MVSLSTDILQHLTRAGQNKRPSVFVVSSGDQLGQSLGVKSTSWKTFVPHDNICLTFNNQYNTHKNHTRFLVNYDYKVEQGDLDDAQEITGVWSWNVKNKHHKVI